MCSTIPRPSDPKIIRGTRIGVALPTICEVPFSKALSRFDRGAALGPIVEVDLALRDLPLACPWQIEVRRGRSAESLAKRRDKTTGSVIPHVKGNGSDWIASRKEL